MKRRDDRSHTPTWQQEHMGLRRAALHTQQISLLRANHAEFGATDAECCAPPACC